MRGVILVTALTLFVRRRTESATDVVVVVMNRFGGKKNGVGEGATVAYYARRDTHRLRPGGLATRSPSVATLLFFLSQIDACETGIF